MTTWVATTPDTVIADRAGRKFADTFGGPPDGIWLAPGRVNLIGEHIDYAGGRCLPLALPYRTAAAVRLRRDGVVSCVSTQTDGGWTGSIADVEPGVPTGWPAYLAGTLWAMHQGGLLPPGAGFDIAIHSTVPVGAGLSSSAALECSVALAAAELTGATVDVELRDLLAQVCTRAENEIACASTGGMDQSIAMHARPDHCMLLDCRDRSFSQVPLDFAAAGLELIVINTNTPHRLNDGQYASRRAGIEQACADMGVRSLRELDGHGDLGAVLTGLSDSVVPLVRHVLSEMERVTESAELLQSGAIRELGALLDASHRSLRDDYRVSCTELDSAVDAALEAGALGARMTGGGFGGSAIALVDRTQVNSVAEAILDRASALGLATPQFLSAQPARAAHRYDY